MASVELVPEEPPAVNPVPVQEVALVEDHVRVDDCPLSIIRGLAESVAVGAILAVTSYPEPLHEIHPMTSLPQE